MFRRILLATALVGTLGASLGAAPAASAGNVAWSVSVGGPGYVVSAGAPAYWGPTYRPYYPAYRPYYVAPPVYVTPVVYAPYRPYYYAPRVIVAPRPVYRGPYYYGHHY